MHIVWFCSYKISRIGKLIQTEHRLVIIRDTEEGEWNQLLYGYKISFWADENVLELDRGGILHNIVNVLSATKLYTLYYVNFTSITII